MVDIGNLDDLIKLMFIDEKCGNLKVVIDGVNNNNNNNNHLFGFHVQNTMVLLPNYTNKGKCILIKTFKILSYEQDEVK